MKFLPLYFLIALSFFALATSAASAAGSCTIVYGGGEICPPTNQISIEKKVMNPSTNSFVDHLGVNDPKFGPNAVMTFQIQVTNTTDTAISKVIVKDTFPQYTTFSSGTGSFENSSNTLSIDVNNLGPRETRTLTVQGKVLAEDKIPTQKCDLANQAVAIVNNKVDRDESKFCIEKKVQGVQTPTTTPSQQPTVIPTTGAGAVPLLALITGGILGIAIKKNSKLS